MIQHRVQRSWRALAALGVVLLLLSGGTVSHLFKLRRDATRVDGSRPSISSILVSGSDCEPLVSVEASSRVVSETDSFIVVAILRNNEQAECRAEISIEAPAFGIRESRRVRLKALSTKREPWILTPQKSGQHLVGVSDGIIYRTIGVRVTDVVGLTPSQAKLLLLWLASLGRS